MKYVFIVYDLIWYSHDGSSDLDLVLHMSISFAISLITLESLTVNKYMLISFAISLVKLNQIYMPCIWNKGSILITIFLGI